MQENELMAQMMIEEDNRRLENLFGHFDPITGEGSTGERIKVDMPAESGLQSPLWLPKGMLEEPAAKMAIEGRAKAGEAFELLRIKHDFPYWAARYVRVKRKGGGDDCPLVLNYAQRMFANKLEEMREGGKPIRIVLLKTRQWGGSTLSQIYMAWLQLVHKHGLNSLIIAHQGTASDEIKDMFDKMMESYPDALLNTDFEEMANAKTDTANTSKNNAKKMVPVGKSRSIFRVPARNCKLKIGTAERPDSCRGGDYNLVHLSEVGLWKRTKGKRPEDIVRSACAGVSFNPDTMIVYESTANGVGNFFHREYVDARDNPRSQFRALFVGWHHVEADTLPFATEKERRDFAAWIHANRNQSTAPSQREESGRYLWKLWRQGATLEGINWYVTERAKHMEHGQMAAECPSDDVEAFVNSGAAVFDIYQVEELRPDCSPPAMTGDVCGNDASGKHALENLRFESDGRGALGIWKLPADSAATIAQLKRMGAIDANCDSSAAYGRYLTVVDIGGRSAKSDWSVIAVFDRIEMACGGRPEIVAQWYGHIDMDLLAWKAAQIAAFYDNSLLVIESNTLETHDASRIVDGDQSQFVLNQLRSVYPNLYARRQSEEDIRQRVPRKYGFHTNISTKPMVVSTLVQAVRQRLYVERDERCLNELLTYERRQNGSFGAIEGAHDDLLMTRAIGLHICFREMEIPGAVTDFGALRPSRSLF